MKQETCVHSNKFESYLPTAPCMKPRMVKLSSYGQNLDSAMFDFLKDSKCTGNKYYSTSQIPYFIGEDLLEHNKGDVELTEDTHNSKCKPEIFTPFFAIEEDLEMEDDVSNSDEHTSETNKYNNQFYLSGSSTEKDESAKHPKRVQSSKGTTPFFGLLSRRSGIKE